MDKKEQGSLTFDQIVIACRNVGINLECGGCASAFFTGYGGDPHDENCTRSDIRKEDSPQRYPSVGDRVYHRNADLFGRVEDIDTAAASCAWIKYEYPYDPTAVPVKVPISELSDGFSRSDS